MCLTGCPGPSQAGFGEPLLLQLFGSRYRRHRLVHGPGQLLAVVGHRHQQSNLKIYKVRRHLVFEPAWPYPNRTWTTWTTLTKTSTKQVTMQSTTIVTYIYHKVHLCLCFARSLEHWG